jgi:signal transduction histidine kinase
MMTKSAQTRPVKRTLSMVFVTFGLIVPVATLVYGWAYASIRENRLKDGFIAEMEARGDPAAAYERNYATWHRRLEAAGLAGLSALLVFAAYTTYVAVKRQREFADKKTAFVAAVTHELRTPLTTLRMHAEMLEQNLVPPQRTARVHEELVRETQRLSRLIENVLAMSKLEEGKWVLDKKLGDLASAVKAVVGTLEPRAHALGFELKFSADAECHPVEFDARALELLTQNLVDNALKYGVGQGPNEVDIEVRPTDRGLQLVVSDHGPGIDVELRERVFDRFDRGGRKDKPGTGLGLALVRELARAHGGDAHILDRERGTAVAVRFPP